MGGGGATIHAQLARLDLLQWEGGRGEGGGEVGNTSGRELLTKENGKERNR